MDDDGDKVLPRNGRRFIDPTISIGNMLTIAGMIVAGTVLYAGKEADLAAIKVQMTHLEHQQDIQDTINAAQDARWQIVLSDLKGDIRDLRTQVDQLIQRK